MRNILTIIFTSLLILSGVAMWLKPSTQKGGKPTLIWISDNNPQRNDQIDKFKEKFPGVDLCLDPFNLGVQKVIVQSTSGVGPDLFDSESGVQLQTYAEAGISWDVTDKARELGFSTNEVLSGVVGEITSEGHQYAYPANVGTTILIYNKNIFDEFKIPYPSGDLTWEEYFELAQKVTRRGKGVSKPVIGIAGLTYNSLFQSQHGEYFSENGAQILLRSPPLVKAFQAYKDALCKYKVTLTSTEIKSTSGQGGWGNGVRNLFADGSFSTILIGKWALIAFRQSYEDQKAKLQAWESSPNHNLADRPKLLRLGSTKMPHFSNMPPCYPVQTRLVSINARSPNRLEALKFLQYLAGPDYSRLINQGVDNIPGNPKYAQLGLEEKYPDLGELEMHANVLEELKLGYQPRKSPFLLISEIDRILKNQISRLESDPTLEVADLLKDAQLEAEGLMQQNLNRNPDLQKRYAELTGSSLVVKGTAF
jgi:ABC-type glycerol-3-phosphate transport system substrate-binding protein